MVANGLHRKAVYDEFDGEGFSKFITYYVFIIQQRFDRKRAKLKKVCEIYRKIECGL